MDFKNLTNTKSNIYFFSCRNSVILMIMVKLEIQHGHTFTMYRRVIVFSVWKSKLVLFQQQRREIA